MSGAPPAKRSIRQRLLPRRRPHATGPFRPRLYTRQAAAPARTLLRRLAIIVAMVVVLFAIFWLDRDGLKDAHDGEVSLIDVVYFTFVTVTTVGYGDIVPVSDRARVIDAVFATPIRLFVLLLFVGTAYELVLQHALEDFRMRRLRDSLRGHVVICGFGTLGRVAADELLARGIEAHRILAIDPRQDAVTDAGERGLIGLLGDATDPDLLSDGCIEAARAAFICAGRDDTNVLICLAARSRAPAVRIVASVREQRQIPILEQSGADAVFSPAGLGGRVMAEAIDRTDISKVFADLASARGEATLGERPASAAEVGRAPREVAGVVVLAVRRGGDLYWAWQAPAQRIESGDQLVFVAPAEPA